jgi:hypothetical protein
MSCKRGTPLLLFLLIVALMISPGVLLRSESQSAQSGPLEDFDSRPAPAALDSPTPRPDTQERLEKMAWNAATHLIYRPNPLSGTPHFLFSYDKSLTEPSTKPASEIAIDFVRENADLFGFTAQELNDLVLENEYVTKHNRVTHLFFQQYHKGLEVFQGELRVHIDKDGRIIAISGGAYPDINLSIEPKLSASEAVYTAAVNIDPDLKERFAPRYKQATPAAAGEITFDRDIFAEDITARLVVFPVTSGARLAWKVMLHEKKYSGLYEMLIDAEDGTLLFRYNHTRYDGPSGYVFDRNPQPMLTPGAVPPSPNPPPIFPRVLKSFAGDESSPRGWVYDTETIGNNVIARTSWQGIDSATAGQTARMTDDVFSHALELGPGVRGPQNFADAAVTNLFYWCNFMHDYYFKLGFDEPAGNFQQENFQPPPNGQARDPVIALAQFGMEASPPRSNNSSFTAQPDGTSPTLRTMVWTTGTPLIDSTLDAEIIVHEYTHGLSSRLIGKGRNMSCLAGAQGGALSEGWSDFFALSVLTPASAELHGLYPFGSYVQQNFSRGTRTRPYTSRRLVGDVPINPLTYANLGKVIDRPEVHADGEIWAQTLWDLRSKLIEQYGFEAGKPRVEQLVVDAMKLAPCNPSMVDMRDAILIADSLKYGSRDREAIWQVFAKRGLGALAFGGNSRTVDIRPSFTEPNFRSRISFSEDVYYPGQQIALMVSDSSAQGNTVSVTVNTAGGDLEQVTLQRTSVRPYLSETTYPSENTFRGTIRSSANGVVRNNRVLEIRPGEIITANYNGITTEATAVVRHPYDITTTPSEFRAVGTRQNVLADNATRQLTLPFPFPFFSRAYKTLNVSDKGLISFTGADSSAQNSQTGLSSRVAIAPMWTNMRVNGRAHEGEDIYVQSTDDAFTIRWAGEINRREGLGQPVNFSATLFRDGRIRFDYGPGNAVLTKPTVGISSGREFYQLAPSYDEAESLTGAPSLVFSPMVASNRPVIEAIEPAVVGPGQTNAVIRGRRLGTDSLVSFSGNGVSAVPRAGGSDTMMPVTLTVAPTAEMVPRTLWITTALHDVGFGPAVLDVVPKPLVLSINPMAGSVGQSIEINGINFSSTGQANTVEFVQGNNRVSATIVSTDTSRLVAIVPRGQASALLSPGTATVVVKTKQVEYVVSGFNVQAAPVAPTLSAVAPAQGVAREAVTISGLGLANSFVNGGQNKVWFLQGDRMMSTNLLANSNGTSVAAEVPKEVQPGDAQIIVQTQFSPGGAQIASPLSNTLAFKVLAAPKPPVIGSVSGQSASQSLGGPGQMIALTGIGFHPTISSNNVLILKEDSGKRFKATATGTRGDGRLIAFALPKDITPGRIDIIPQVRFSGSDSSEGDKLFGRFLVTQGPRPPVLSSFNLPAGASPGQVLIINGNGFSADPVKNKVLFKQGDVAIPATVLGASSVLNTLDVRVPLELATGPVVLEATVTVGCQESRSSTGIGYNILAPINRLPRITSLEPLPGRPPNTTRSGDLLVVKGANFIARWPEANIVRFGETVATVIEAKSSSELSVIVPYTLPPGPTDVTVEVAGQPRSAPVSFLNPGSLSPLRTIQFAQFADGEDLNSTITVFNPSFTETATAEVALQSADGETPLTVNLNGRRMVGHAGFSIPPLGLVALASDECSRPTQAGSVKVTSKQPLAGTVLFSTRALGAAGVGESLPATRSIAPIERNTSKNVNTGLAIVNAGPRAAEVRATLRDETGRERGNTQFSLAGNSQRALFIDELFDPATLGVFRGSLLITASEPVATTVLRLAPQSLSTLPVAIESQGTRNLYFSHFATGGGITSTITIINPSETSSTTGTIHLFDQSGSPITSTIDGRLATDGTFPFSLPPRAVGMYTMGDDPRVVEPLETGSVLIMANNNISGTVLFDINGGGTAGVGSSQPTTQFLAPVERRLAHETNTGLAIANIQNSTITVRLQLLNEKGEQIGVTELSLRPQGQTARFLTELFREADINDFRGLVVATANTPGALIGTVLRVTPTDIATLPVTPTSGR